MAADLPPPPPTSSHEDGDYLAQLTLQMANDMFFEQKGDANKKPGSVPPDITTRDMPRWADLFGDSPRSTLRPSSGSSYCSDKASVHADKFQREDDPSWDDPSAYVPPGIAEYISRITTISCRDDNNTPGHCLSEGKRTKESGIRPEMTPEQGNSGKRNPHVKNNQWRTGRGLVQGESYVGLYLPRKQKAGHPKAEGSGTRAAFKPESRSTGSTGTGVFLPKTAGNGNGSVTERGGRKQRCSTVLIPERVAHALMLHFSKTSHPHHHPSPSSAGVDSPARFGDSHNFRQKRQADKGPETEPAINCNEMGLPQEWIY